MYQRNKRIKVNRVSDTLLNTNITIQGYIQHIRIHSNIIFLDVRDDSGIIQVILEDKNYKLSLESCYIYHWHIEKKYRQSKI